MLTDNQGSDLFTVAGMRGKHYNRVANLMVECQELPLSHVLLLAPGVRNCSEVVSCVVKWFAFTFRGCRRNMATEEYNCIFFNPRHPLHSTSLEPKHMSSEEDGILTPRRIVQDGVVCPEWLVAGGKR